MRLAKYLAHAGIASRRHAEELIRSGRIRVNDRIISDPGTLIDAEKDRVEFDGVAAWTEGLVYVLLNKPVGVLSTVSDPRGRPTVIGILGHIKQRIYPVGRLDYDSAGLLLLSNDGHFTNLMIHPRYKIPKTYDVWVEGRIGPAEIQRLREGIMLDDGVTAPAQVRLLESGAERSRLELVIREGRKRQVKRMLAAVGHRVTALTRTGFGFLQLSGLEPGQYRSLSPAEVEGLMSMARAGPTDPTQDPGASVPPGM